jgi:hypothetical protein
MNRVDGWLRRFLIELTDPVPDAHHGLCAPRGACCTPAPVKDMMQRTTGRIDRRYSGKDAEAVRWAEAEDRLCRGRGRLNRHRAAIPAHAMPIVSVSWDGRIYFRTGIAEVKYRWHRCCQPGPRI